MISECKLNKAIRLHVKGSISKEDADRQERTAKEILKRFGKQPGMILADEVGMGKTFVALAVAVSVVLNDEKKRPVVVMVPPSLQQKWPDDFMIFRERCLDGIPVDKLKFGTANRAVQFLKLLDDPEDRRKQLIFVTHGAMSRGLINNEEVWIRVAVLWYALRYRRDADKLKKSLAKQLSKILKVAWVEQQLTDARPQEFWYELLSTHPRYWLAILHKQCYKVDPEGDKDSKTDDDPVPEAVWQALPQMKKADIENIYKIIKRVPHRSSPNIESRRKEIRDELNIGLGKLWPIVLDNLSLNLPLLILDEAHHLKNSGTKLASLFHFKEAKDDAELVEHGPLGGAFERMLFLTATPFQLGHYELCNVLSRFSGISWKSDASPPYDQSTYGSTMDKIHNKLNQTQVAAHNLDRSWTKLTQKDLSINGRAFATVEEWFAEIDELEGIPDLTAAGNNVLAAIRNLQEMVKVSNRLIKPWIIRHQKPDKLVANQVGIPRRSRHAGASIKELETVDHAEGVGIPIEGEGLLPFLLAARTAAIQGSSRPIYAEGLSSSFEAFRNTRLQSLQREGRYIDDDDDNSSSETGDNSSSLNWYLNYLDSYPEKYSKVKQNDHPKMKAVVEKVSDLWEQGEKVVVFCHYIQTGKALRQYVSDEIKVRIAKLGYRRLGCARSEVRSRLEEFSSRIERQDSPLNRAAKSYVEILLAKHSINADLKSSIIDLVVRYLRTDSFLVRYFPLQDKRPSPSDLREAMRKRYKSNMSLERLIDDFISFLENKCRNDNEREAYINAIDNIKMGSIYAKNVDTAYNDDELQGAAREELVPNVRLVNGATRRETRQTIMKAFNTPFFPEILIASSVLSEGVDLHLNCRYVIHHDLCWNPSTLEQRTGRVDRIGAKAEKCERPIEIYLPYIAETQDEKMYRVVMDRERWFNVVMGAGYNSNDNLSTEKEANRLPLPEALAKELSLNLEI